MPDLPPLTLNQAHFDRVVNAFPGSTAAQKTQSYRNWLINRLIEFVETQEARAIDESANAHKREQLEQLAASLPDPLPFPPDFT